jgi:hypothetical protein
MPAHRRQGLAFRHDEVSEMGLRYPELGIEIFIRRDIKLIFTFDEFEEMLQCLPGKFFQTRQG